MEDMPKVWRYGLPWARPWEKEAESGKKDSVKKKKKAFKRESVPVIKRSNVQVIGRLGERTVEVKKRLNSSK
jgi:hypothetical protein